MSADMLYGGPFTGLEIDWEYYDTVFSNPPGTSAGTVHDWAQNNIGNGVTTTLNGDGQWHVNGILWIPGQTVSFYVDGQLIGNPVDISCGGPMPGICGDYHMPVILGTAAGWPEIFDWVHVWQLPAGAQNDGHNVVQPQDGFTGGNGSCTSGSSSGSVSNSSSSSGGVSTGSGSGATTSPSCTIGQAVVDGQGNVWTISAGVVLENGAPAGSSNSVIDLAYVNGLVYQENSSNNWWYWGGGTWVATSDPTASCGSSTSSGSSSGSSSSGSSTSSSGGTSSSGSSGGAVSSSCDDPTAIFCDNFTSYNSNLWYYNSFYEGGDALWDNDPALIPQIYTYSDAGMDLNLLPTPAGYGISEPYISGDMETCCPTDAFLYQYGYWELTVAVPNFAGLMYEASIISTTTYPPIMITRIYTDSNNNEYAEFYTDQVLPSIGTPQGFDPSQYHTYGWNWTPDVLEIYIDRVLFASEPSPGGDWNTPGNVARLKMWDSTGWDDGLGVGGADIPDPANPAALPVGAHLRKLEVWPNKPY